MSMNCMEAAEAQFHTAIKVSTGEPSLPQLK